MRVVISGGGTGGHIYPALAIIEQLRAKHANLEVIYVGSEKGLERDLVAKAAIPGVRFEAMEVSGFRRSLSLSNFRTVWLFIKAIQKSKTILRSFQPDVVIGTGGYVCAPVVYAAAKAGIASLIHEQNAVAGLTNLFLSRYVHGVAVSFRGSERAFANAKNVRYTGNPRASQIRGGQADLARKKYGIEPAQKLVLMVGGSRGALALNQTAQQWVERVSRQKDMHLLIVSGERYFQEWRNQCQLKNKGIAIDEENEQKLRYSDNVTIIPYAHDMPDLLSATHVVIGRAGASSIAEWTALGMPTILIPSPNVTNNHQEANARSLVDVGAAVMIREKELSVDGLDQAVRKLVENETSHRQMCAAAKGVGQADAANLIEEYIRDILKVCQGAH